MHRLMIVCALILPVPFASASDTSAEQTETVIRLTVPPKPAPKPALKYQLLPELTEMQSGNPILGYLRCFSEQHNFFHNREAVLKREEYQKMPLASLPVKELKGYGQQILEQADYAARLDTPDWQMLYKMRKEGTHLLLPDLQGMRDLTRVLKVRFRVAVAEKQFDAGIRTAKTMFALSRHVGKHPTLIGDLVAMAIANETIGPLEEMLQQPGCPNLYWALTELPSPLVEIRNGIRGERVLDGPELARISDRRPMTVAELEHAIDAITDLYDRMTLKFGLWAPSSKPVKKDNADGKSPRQPGKENQGDITPREWLTAIAKDAASLRAARKRLVDAGLDEKKVASFPPLQVIFLDEKREFEERRDDHTKGMLLPYWQGESFLAKSRLKKQECLFRLLIPVCTKIRNLQARLDQRLALLRTVEALRLHGAAHAGQLPDNLTDVAVPLPIDPITGKPFHYTKDGNKATLQGGAPVGQEKNATFNLRYEVTIKP